MDQAELVGAVETLTRSVDDLAERFDRQQTLIDRIEKQRRGLAATRIALALVAVLMVSVGLLAVRLESTTQELQEVQARTSTDILCPLYAFLALSLKANPPNPAASEEQIAARNIAADTIGAGLSKLGCA